MHKTSMIAWRYVLVAGIAVLLECRAEAQFKPVPFPKDIGVPGFVFPTPQATIDGWVQADDVTSMAGHAWGIWIGLNSDSGEVFENQKLRIFESWNEDSELQGAGRLLASSAARTQSPFKPKALRQFRFKDGKRSSLNTPPPADAPLGFVKFDPTAADHIIRKKLLSKQTLEGLLVPGQISNVPDFPITATSLKVETTAVKSDPSDPGYFKLNVWPGPPATPQAFGQDKWNSFVWIDLNPKNAGTGDGSVGHNQDTRKPGSTYSINDFINFKDANGTTSIVVGLHVTTREITKWTWQTFWWAPDAAKPPLPSSKAIADARPKVLLTMGAPAHYAVALAYSMKTPKGADVFGYNPYLEASFSGLAGKYQFGVQTNCMSCHANASFTGIPNAYVGDEDVDIGGAQFKGQVRLDFLYSLQNAQD